MADYYVYILANRRRNVLYAGVTNNLRRRVSEHKTKVGAGFTARYNVDDLVYFEHFKNPKDAITREKQIKAGSRAAKMRMIKAVNPSMEELDIADK